MKKFILLEVEPNPSGAWDPDSEVAIGEFGSKEEAVAFARASLREEGWGETEIDQMPTPGATGSRYQLREG